jgi:KTSC domain
MAWVLLDSSLFIAARYSEREQLLDLEFRSGAIYRYFRFPPDEYAEFMKADSHGAHFNRYIVGQFPEEQRRPPRAKPR